MKHHPKSTVLMLALVVGAGAGLAVAARAAGSENDAVASLAQARIDMTQAVDLALAQTAGRATRAELGDVNGHAVYEVEVVASSNQVFDVKVDAVAGKVLSSTPDPADHEDEEKDGDKN
jgi:uncharacterized membrane protein YkoI